MSTGDRSMTYHPRDSIRWATASDAVWIDHTFQEALGSPGQQQPNP